MEDDGRKNLIFNVRLSSLVPDLVTGDDKSHHEFTDMDLAMKLHYLRSVYLFGSEAAESFAEPTDLRRPICPWLSAFYMTAGRIRRRAAAAAAAGRPFLKCNDSGIRCVEAECSKTVEEWVAMEDVWSLNERLVYSEPLGPPLSFSPLVYLQLTRFKCGGVAVGLRWAHVLGDPFAAISYANEYGRFLSGQRSLRPLLQATSTGTKPKPSESKNPPVAGKPLSVKRVGPVGDHWENPDPPRILTHSFRIAAWQLDRLRGATGIGDYKPFEVLSALAWKSLARVRGNSSLRRVVTLRRGDGRSTDPEIPRNRQRIGVVEAGFQASSAGLRELAELICDKTSDESELIEGIVGEEDGNVDFVVYGANLTFVDLGEAEVYGMEVKGHKPVLASFIIDGVGEEGAVLVLPAPETDEKGGGRGWTVTVYLLEDQLIELKNEFRREWGII